MMGRDDFVVVVDIVAVVGFVVVVGIVVVVGVATFVGVDADTMLQQMMVVAKVGNLQLVERY
jgi:hypothetical protein